MSRLGNGIRGKILALAAIVAVVGAGVSLGSSLTPEGPAEAASMAQFNPANIISDEKFYDANAMSEGQIQDFLVTTGGALQSLRFSVASRATSVSDTTGNVRCQAFTGGSDLLASTIIFRAQAACGISAKVILVTLQKEQALIGKASPSQAALDRAMGMACPDTAPCAVDKLGFGNQVYEGAKQLNTYRASRFGMQPGVNTISWHPNAACGNSTFTVSNYATAALYNYTPYRPNGAALANYPGIGDSCSSYGNRNFWAFYSDWFGSPTAPITPIGTVDSVTSPAGAQVRVRGWTFTPGKQAPISIHVYVDGQFTSAAVADGLRGDVEAAYPSQGPNHGYDHTFAVSAGGHQVCVYALDELSGGNAALGCQAMTVGTAPIVDEPFDPTVPAAVYRFWSAAYKAHFYTVSKAERDHIIATNPKNVWAYEGAVYGAFRSQMPGTVPLYRFWSTAYNGHFYTSSETEKNQVIAGYDDSTWKYESVAYYVYPATYTVEATRPVARFWGPAYKHHFYTADAAEAANLKQNYPASVWAYESDVFRVPLADPPAAPLP